MTVITRFAPSPTGMLHLGGARTALFCYLFSKHMGGQFLLRVEDTDRERSTDEATQAILDGMRWLGLTWDGDVVYQSRNQARHAAVVQQLLDAGKAYRCYASPEELEEMRATAMAAGLSPRYDGRWRDPAPNTPIPNQPPAIRLRAPQTGSTVVNDLIQGRIEVDNSQLDDMVLLRSDGTPTYMLSVVVDDHDMNITHVIRGADHLTNSFRQVQLYQAMGWPIPEFGHIPLIHGNDGQKLSKRHGAMGLDAYRAMGILPVAMRNYLLRLGWGHGDDEIISDAQAIEWFDLSGVGKAPARYDLDKLLHLNSHYMKQLPPDALMKALQPFLAEWKQERFGQPLLPDDLARVGALLPALLQRAQTLVELTEGSDFLLNPHRPTPDEAAAAKLAEANSAGVLSALANRFDQRQPIAAADFESTVKELANDLGKKMPEVAMPLRAALTGRLQSPAVGETCAALGLQRVLERLRAA
ncbi:MAG: glutamate--tRNA ligase [Holosporaceae bacterium]|jgi:glutamyl-tRNA synthetase|nr:glutamate--tRNA ligase [Rhodospirillaceae bacterium]